MLVFLEYQCYNNCKVQITWIFKGERFMRRKMYLPISEKIRCMRLAIGKTQRQMAYELSVTRSCLCNYESGKRQPDIEMLGKLARYFNIETSYFLEERYCDMLSLSEDDAREHARQVKSGHLPERSINMENMSPDSRIALRSFYEYLKYCDNRNKRIKYNKE